MTSKKPPSKIDGQNKIVAEARQSRSQREKTYREKALKMYPWVCARCGREFSGKKLRELTVHHRDHNHDYNPPDGSNWELLCLYCHDNEHQKYEEHLAAIAAGQGASGGRSETKTTTHRPFGDLASLLKKGETD